MTEEEQLLLAIRLKAEAFANKEWTQYWNTHGPSMLAAGWVAVHPHIPLQQLQDSIQSLGFLTLAMDQLGLASTTAVAAMDQDSVSAGDEIGSGPAQKEFERLKQEVSENFLEAGVSEEREEPSAEMGGAGGDCMPSTDELLHLWDEHYNGYYWYAYQMFCQQAQGDILVLYQAEMDRKMEGEEVLGGGDAEKEAELEGEGLGGGDSDEAVKDIAGDMAEDGVEGGGNEEESALNDNGEALGSKEGMCQEGVSGEGSGSVESGVGMSVGDEVEGAGEKIEDDPEVLGGKTEMMNGEEDELGTAAGENRMHEGEGREKELEEECVGVVDGQLASDGVEVETNGNGAVHMRGREGQKVNLLQHLREEEEEEAR